MVERFASLPLKCGLEGKRTIFSKQFGKTKEPGQNSFDFIVLILSFDSSVLFTSVGIILFDAKQTKIERKVLPN